MGIRSLDGIKVIEAESAEGIERAVNSFLKGEMVTNDWSIQSFHVIKSRRPVAIMGYVVVLENHS